MRKERATIGDLRSYSCLTAPVVLPLGSVSHSLPLPFPPGTECTTRGESEEPRVGRSVTGGDHEVETAGGRY